MAQGRSNGIIKDPRQKDGIGLPIKNVSLTNDSPCSTTKVYLSIGKVKFSHAWSMSREYDKKIEAVRKHSLPTTSTELDV